MTSPTSPPAAPEMTDKLAKCPRGWNCADANICKQRWECLVRQVRDMEEMKARAALRQVRP